MIDATLIAVPSSTKNAGGRRDVVTHQAKTDNGWNSGMKAQIGVGADSAQLVHTFWDTAAKVSYVVETNHMPYGQEADTGYQGAAKRHDANEDVCWHIGIHTPGQAPGVG